MVASVDNHFTRHRGISKRYMEFKKRNINVTTTRKEASRTGAPWQKAGDFRRGYGIEWDHQ